MKVECPICHVQGFALVRGRNVIIQHYIGYHEGKRIYQYHRIPYETFQMLQVSVSKNASNCLQVKNLKTDPESQLDELGRSSSLVGHLLDVQRVVGSSPARPTKHCI